jgi:hypothetical protein
MSLELWSGQGGYFFMDTFNGCPVQVGQAFQERAGGPWTVGVNNASLTAPDLEAAKRLFVKEYDRSRVTLSPLSLDPELAAAYAPEFTIVDLSPLQKSKTKSNRARHKTGKHSGHSRR